MLAVSNLSKVYPTDRGSVHAVKDVSFEVEDGSFYTLLGPSGCGKTTTLRCIAGLERQDAGEIRVGERVLSGGNAFVPPHQRDIGMVFQSYAIWPHMTVFENVAFPLRVGKDRPSAAEVRNRVAEALHTVHLDGLEERPAPQLSGGQQQRLALARALVRRPKLLLLDEPLSNLDAKLRAGLRIEIRDLQQRLGITTLYVTHDQIEALAMSSVVAVMSEGLVAQEGPPREVYEKPNSRYVAEFIGTTNFLPGRVVNAAADGTLLVQTDAGQLTCQPARSGALGRDVLVSIRPEYVAISEGPTGHGANALEGTLRTAVFLGEFIDCVVDVAGHEIHVRAHPSLALREGQRVSLVLPKEQCVAIEDVPVAVTVLG
jgi:iron(III) transport system ATP-binding protein